MILSRWCGLCFAAIWFAGCSAPRGPAAPAHEFLVTAGDSTFWVRGESAGILVRGAPLLLARLDGRFHELYVTDDDRSYFDAILLSQRLWRRDLVTGDSLLVFEDSLIAAMARSHARAHPDEIPLRPDEEASSDPETWAAVELEILDVHGPFLSYEYHADLETRGGESRLTTHGVLDLDSARRVTLGALYGDSAAERIESQGRRQLSVVLDSILAANAEVDRRRAEAVTDFAFDASSFTIVEVGGNSAVAFAVPGRGPLAGGLTLELDPIPGGAPAWWSRIRATLPSSTKDPLVDDWRGTSYDVIARYSSGGDTAVLAVRDSLREWLIGTFPSPVSRIDWLDAPAIDTTDRRALSRAFDAAALYDLETTIVQTTIVVRPELPAEALLATNTRSALPPGKLR